MKTQSSILTMTFCRRSHWPYLPWGRTTSAAPPSPGVVGHEILRNAAALGGGVPLRQLVESRLRRLIEQFLGSGRPVPIPVLFGDVAQIANDVHGLVIADEGMNGAGFRGLYCSAINQVQHFPGSGAAVDHVSIEHQMRGAAGPGVLVVDQVRGAEKFHQPVVIPMDVSQGHDALDPGKGVLRRGAKGQAQRKKEARFQ